MAQRLLVLSMSMAFAAALLAQQATAQTSGCMIAVVSLSPCLGFTTGNTSTPGSSCCSALASVVQSSPRCLCTVLGGGASSFGVTINSTRALELPGACKIQTPPVSQCNAVGVPVASPTATPATPSAPSGTESPVTPTGTATAKAPSMPATMPSTTGAGSKTTPSTSTVSSDAGATKFVTIPIVFFIAAFASIMNVF